MPAQARQQTQDVISDSDPEGYDEDDPKGKKKGPNNQAARRDQNRIAQREFRLRKQQRIRDLELRVELSASKDEAFTALDGMLQDLQRENAALRQLVKDLSNFIGEGIGGFLPKLGWDPTSFEEFKNRSETDTMSESYQARKKNPGVPANVVPLLAGQTASSVVVGQKRGREESVGSNGIGGSGVMGRKRPKPNEPEQQQNGYGPPPPPPPQQVYQNLPPQANSSIFTHGQTPTSYLPSGPSSSYPPPPNQNTGVPPIPPPPINTSLPPNVGMYNTTPTSSVQPYPQMGRMGSDQANVSAGGNSVGSGASVSSSHQDESSLQRRDEAARLTHYHLNNYKRNPSYCLPASLRPTHIQRTVAHDFIIDGIPIPELRDKLILMKGKYDLADCAHLLFSSGIIHTDDVLAIGNWEIGEEWFRRFGFLATRSVLETTNKWRRERGDPEIPLSLIDGDMDPVP